MVRGVSGDYESMQASKQRGVRASRLKLEKALADSPLTRKTQVAIANAIADAEELDAAPKDLVSRVFRELPVDAQTIARVARVLDVDARELYLTEEDPAWPVRAASLEPAAHDSKVGGGDSGQSELVRSLRQFAILALGGLAIAAIALFTYNPGIVEHMACRAGLPNGVQSLPQDRLGVLVARFAGDRDNEAQMLLARAFAGDTSLADTIAVDTTCRRPSLVSDGSLQNNFRRAREQAGLDLEASNAQVLLWGERFGDRLIVRFATKRDPHEPLALDVEGQSVLTSEQQFSLPLTLEGAQPIPPALKRIALQMMPLEKPDERNLRQRAIDAFANSSGWLRDAVLTDRNLLDSISYVENPRLYVLTASQLCYRYRLLGEFEGRDREFARAEETCRDVLERVSRKASPDDWATLKINLGSVMIRRHLFDPTAKARIQRLKSAIETLRQAEPLIDKVDGPDNFATYHRNLGVAYLRLAELLGGDPDARGNIDKAVHHTVASLEVLDAETRPVDYSQARQNLCVSQYRLGTKTDEPAYFAQAIANCRRATAAISPRTSPQDWAMAQNNLAVSYALQAEALRRPQSLRRALTEFAKAQTVYSRADYPAKWAEVEANKAELNCRLGVMAQDRGALRQSKAHGEAALEQFSKQQMERYVDYVDSLLDNVQACTAATRWAKCNCSVPMT